MNATVRIGKAKGFAYSVYVAPVDATPGQHNVVVTSHFGGAKDPRSEQRRLQVIVTVDELDELVDMLCTYLRMHRS